MRKIRKYRLFLAIAGILLFVATVVILLAPEDWYEVSLDIEGEGFVLPATELLYTPGATAHVSAEPAPNSHQGFSGWRGDITGYEDNVSFEVTRHMRATAVFSDVPPPGQQFRSLNIAVSGTGAGATRPEPGSYLHLEGKDLLVEAIPGTGSYFAGWLESRPEHNTPAQPDACLRHALSMDQDIVLIARFHSEGHRIMLEQEGPGTITPEPGVYALAKGLEWELRALPDPDCRLRHWENEAGVILHVPEDEEDAALPVAVVSDATYRAVFEKAERELLVRTLQEGKARGRIEPAMYVGETAKIIPYGQVVNILAIPENSDTAFAGWAGTLPEDLSNTQYLSPELRLVMTEDRQITARFVEPQTRLTLQTLVDGKPDPRADALLSPVPGTYGFVRNAAAGIELTAAMIPGSPLAFECWEGDLPHNADAEDSRIYLPMDTDRRVNARFIEAGAIPVTLGCTDDGTTIPAPGRYTVVAGQSLMLEAVPEQDAFFGGWRVRRGNNADVFYIENPLSLPIEQATEASVMFGRQKLLFWVDTSDAEAEIRPARGEYWLAKGTQVTLEAKSTPGRHFHYWESSQGEKISENPIIQVQVDRDGGYAARFGPPLYRLKLDTAGDGKGGIETDAENPSRIAHGSSVRLTAKAEPDAVFSHWEGDLPNTADHYSPEIDLLMDGDKTIRARFDIADHQMTITVTRPDTSTLPLILPFQGTRGYRDGAEVALAAFPPPGAEITFTGWTGDIISPSPEQPIIMDRDWRVAATFGAPEKENTAVLELLPASGPGNCRFLPVEPGRYSFLKGAALKVSLILPQDTFFAGWSHDYPGEIQYTGLPVTLDRDKTLGPVLSDQGATLSIMLDGGEGGTVHPPPGVYRLADGLETELTAECTDDDWVFDGWFNAAGKRLSYRGRLTVKISTLKPKTEMIAVFRRYQAPPELVLCGRPSPY